MKYDPARYGRPWSQHHVSEDLVDRLDWSDFELCNVDNLLAKSDDFAGEDYGDIIAGMVEVLEDGRGEVIAALWNGGFPLHVPRTKSRTRALPKELAGFGPNRVLAAQLWLDRLLPSHARAALMETVAMLYDLVALRGWVKRMVDD